MKNKASNAMRTALRGLSDEQKVAIRLVLNKMNAGHQRIGQDVNNAQPTDTRLEGWSVYREPTTINPPTILRLHHRGIGGKLVRVVSITEKGQMCSLDTLG